MVPITPELVPQLLDDPADLLLGEVCAADLYTLSKPKLIAELVVVTGRDFKHSCERKRVPTVGKLRAEHFHARVEHAQPDRGCVLVDPVHVVHVQDYRLAASHRGRQQLVASAVLWHPEAAGEGQIAGKPVREHHHNSIQAGGGSKRGSFGDRLCWFSRPIWDLVLNLKSSTEMNKLVHDENKKPTRVLDVQIWNCWAESMVPTNQC